MSSFVIWISIFLPDVQLINDFFSWQVLYETIFCYICGYDSICQLFYWLRRNKHHSLLRLSYKPMQNVLYCFIGNDERCFRIHCTFFYFHRLLWVYSSVYHTVSKHISKCYTLVCSSRTSQVGSRFSQRKTAVLAAALVDDCSLLMLSSTLRLEVKV